jgi:beta-galactosidase
MNTPTSLPSENGTSVWAGPPTRELSVMALRKSFAHQITRASGIWWFDMWGGWYDDPLLMETLAQCKEIQDRTVLRADRDFAAEVAVIADEQAKENLCAHHPFDSAVRANHIVTGNTGAPFDGEMAEDIADYLHKYKAVIFPSPIPSPTGERAMALCRQKDIPYLTATLEHPLLTLEEQVDFLKKAEVHLYAEGGDVVYAGNGYVALHSETGGEKQLFLPAERKVTPLFGAADVRVVGSRICFVLEACDTALFRIEA